ncbi:MAG: hypothetical protein APR63_12225 [Desulfuromonas sp. SDB]|nr:MAG: hypothetical protein APR63_12225 [Desulfuromonas sp. SDB]
MKKADSFGQALVDCYQNGKSIMMVERSDGYLDLDQPADYFKQYKDWPDMEKKAIKYAKSPVLDVGCGAGRHSLYLQNKGMEVLGIDQSSLCVELAKRRGLKNCRWLDLKNITSDLGMFRTILMLGNNLGLLENMSRARVVLRKFSRITTPDGLIIGECVNPYKTEDSYHLEYQKQNRKRGKLSGELRLRIRYKNLFGPWFNYLFASPEELEKILGNTGWKINQIIESPETMYIAVIGKD